MKLTQFTRDILRARREIRELKREGFEQLHVHVNGEPRFNERFVDVRIACDGQFIFVRKEPRR